jgi:hypothetical protein
MFSVRNDVMKLVKTSMTGSTVWLRFADDDDPAKAKEWVDVQVPIRALKAPAKKLGMFAQADVDWGFTKAPSADPLGEVSRQTVGALQLAALRHVKGLIDLQTRALSSQP